MPETLFDRLRRLRRRVVQLVSLDGASWFVAVVFTAVLAVGLVDWAVHLDDPGVRLVLGLGILALAVWIAWTRLVAPLRESFSDVELALRVERRYPGFKDSLASTVQFLHSGHDPALGSPELQKQVVADTLRRVEQVDVSDVVETRPVLKIAALAMGVCLVIASIVATNQAAAATALSRLVFPFSSGAWPRTVELRLIDAKFEPIVHDPADPLRVARGTQLELFVENARGPLPDDVRLELGLESEHLTTEKLRRATLRDDANRVHDVAAISIQATKGPLRFRALGGDDHAMPFHRLEVVPPPLVDELQVTLTPPRYSGRPVETLPPGVGHVEGLVGSTVSLSATVNKPLKSARLRVKDRPAVTMELLPGGREFRATFEIAEPGAYAYWFDLRDVQGFENPDAPRYQIRGIADAVPDVSIASPATDVNVTADAEVPFRIVVRDDLGIRSIGLAHRRGDGPAAVTGAVPLFDGEGRPQQQSAEHTLRLGELRQRPPDLPVHVGDNDPRADATVPLQPGVRILVHGEATDDFDLGGQHVGRSIARVLTIVSPEEKKAELAARQSSLVDELERVVQGQTRAREQVQQLLLQLEKAGTLQPADLDLLKRIELDQKQIASRLADPADSVESRAREIVSELRQNRLDDPPMKARLDELAADVELLREEHLPAIERELTRARKAATPLSPKPTPEDPQPGARPASDDDTASLRRVGENQDAVLDTLGGQLRKLAEWRSRRDVSEEAGELIAGQKQLHEETADVGRRTLAKPAGDLTPQELADLARLADRQVKQGERVAQFRSRLVELANELEEANPTSARTLRDAHDDLRRQATAERMRDVAGQIEKNNVGQATAGQRQILDELSSLQNALRERPTDDLESLVKQLEQAEEELDTLRKREETLRKEIDDAFANPDEGERRQELERLRKEQERLRDDTQAMARRLRRLQSRPAGEAARRAADRMQRAEDALERDAGEQAQEALDEALDDLEQAERELARQRQEAEERLAQELLERIADQIASMVARQQAVIDETVRLDTELKDRGNWTRGQLKTLVGLADTQRALKDETDRLAEQVRAAEIFSLALRGAARSMDLAARRLAERKTDAATVDAEKAALKRFLDLTASLEPDKRDDDGPSPKKPPDAREKDSGDGPPTDGIPPLAQLRLLKTLQEDLLARTIALDAVRGKEGALSAEQQAELDAIALEQGQLADLARNLVQRLSEAAEPDDAP